MSETSDPRLSRAMKVRIDRDFRQWWNSVGDGTIHKKSEVDGVVCRMAFHAGAQALLQRCAERAEGEMEYSDLVEAASKGPH